MTAMMTMTKLLSPRLYAAGAKRSYSLLATTRLSEILSNNNQTHVNQCSINNNFTAAQQHQSITATKPYNSLLQLQQQQQQQQQRIIQRSFSKYVSVDHSSAYTDAINSSHGQQLQLALEEGRGKDDAPFDPFSAFLDEMGQTTDDVNKIDSNDDDDNIEEAEFEEHDKQDEDSDLDGHHDEDDDEFDNDDDAQPMYDVTGAPLRPKSERLALRAGYPSGGTFAVIYLAGFQHKVTKDDLLVVNKLKPVSEWCVGSTHTIKGNDVLLVANQHKTCVGLPGVSGAEVDVMVEEITRDKTMIIFKKRRRKHSRRKNGFRRQVTFLRVLDVRMPQGEVDVDGLESESMAA